MDGEAEGPVGNAPAFPVPREGEKGGPSQKAELLLRLRTPWFRAVDPSTAKSPLQLATTRAKRPETLEVRRELRQGTGRRRTGELPHNLLRYGARKAAMPKQAEGGSRGVGQGMCIGRRRPESMGHL